MAVAVDQLLYLLDEAFTGNDWHSLLGNLRDITDDEWCWTPPRGSRSLRDMVEHIGSCKIMYEDYAFGDASLGWEDPVVTGGVALESVATALAWLREAHERLRYRVSRLDDVDLDQRRLTNWGEQRETRWIIAVMIQHDLYHAGEINHLRALYRGDDRWEHERDA
ncbi:MAG TPA: DinB family protein [Thermomicrobiales bacterium]|nr:DinB family protein [Thermomicrobiales bacterium]